MAGSHNPVTDRINGFGSEQADIVSNTLPVERSGLVPGADLEHGPQPVVILGEVLKLVVIQIAAQADG